MDTTLSADEIFDKAEEIERQDAQFYREAAQKASTRKVRQVRQLLLDLATMEDGHLKIFENMRKDFNKKEDDPSILDTESIFYSYTQIVAESPKSEGAENSLERLTDNKTVEEVMLTAIERENRSILFYVGLQNLFHTQADKDRLEAIIREEINHVVSLNLCLTTLI